MTLDALMPRGLAHLEAGRRCEALVLLRRASRTGTTRDDIPRTIARLAAVLGQSGEAVCAAYEVTLDGYFGEGRGGMDREQERLLRARIAFAHERDVTPAELQQGLDAARALRDDAVAAEMAARLDSPPAWSATDLVGHAAIVCQQQFGDTCRVEHEANGISVLLGRAGFRVEERAGELVVRVHRIGLLGRFASAHSAAKIQQIEATVRAEVGKRRYMPLRCPRCKLRLERGMCGRCERPMSFDDLIACASDPVPAGADPRCPWCEAIVEPYHGRVTHAFRCTTCGALALGMNIDPDFVTDEAINVFKIPTDHPAKYEFDQWPKHFGVESCNEGSPFPDGWVFRWFRRRAN